MSRDVKHHLKYVQKKMLKASRQEENAKVEKFQKDENSKNSEKLEASEEKKFDPHHRTPRVFKKRDYH